MQIKLPESVNFIIETLADAGYEAYAVGGCVRDSILGREPNDWDITTSAKPNEVKALFSRTIDTGLQHGTVTVRHNHESYEVTTYRIDGEYEDSRHPKDVEFTTDLSEDLLRRDFTINAMAYNNQEGLVDLFQGLEDMEAGIIRAVGDPSERFSEDALRMMRAIRFAAQLGFEIDPDTYEAIKVLAPSIDRISKERIQVELVKLVTSNHPEKMIDLYETGLTKYILPEFDAMMECPQNTKYHKYNVGRHTIVSMQEIEADKISRLTMLLHDVAKPACRVTKEGVDHFYGHPAKSADMARDILRRLKFDNNTIKQVSNLCRWHDERPEVTEYNVRKLIVKVGVDSFPRWFSVKRADALAQSEYMMQEKLDTIDEIESIYNDIIAKGQCLSVKELAINGSDLLDIGADKGPILGEILDRLFAEVLKDPELNNRDYLLMRSKQLIRK